MKGWLYDQISGGSPQQFARKSSGVAWKRQPAIHVLHTTETTGWPGYSGGDSAPHFTIHPQLRQTRQHFPITAGARALRPGGVNANEMGTIQYEIIGYAAQSHTWPDDDLVYIAHVLAIVGREAGIPAQASVAFRGSAAAYGTGSSTRLSKAAFHSYAGILGHQHIPGNTHWDPGEININRLVQLIGGGITPPAPKPAPPASRTNPRVIVRGLTGDDVLASQEDLARLGFYSGKLDGICGPIHEAAILAFQTAAGIARDKAYGPISRAKAKSVPNFPGTTRRGMKGTGRTLPHQKRLKALKLYTGALDDIHGKLTDAAIEAAQRARSGLVVDRISGPATWTGIHTR